MKIAFLDRDGVINQFPGFGKYVTKVKDFHFIPGSIEAIVDLTKRGYAIFVVSNQAGVAKGIYSERKLEQINDYMMRHVKKAGGRIKKVFYCRHRSDAGCDCRKPNIGSIERALKIINKESKDAKYAYFVGDDKTDIEAGHNAGCKTILVLSGKNQRKDAKSWAVQPDFIAQTLSDARKIIINENSSYSCLGRSRTPKSR
ncbi:MAG: HAD family hydrolase [Candidatus Omnitrophica bacterium]|nr:HAD family hydrolase [Candidatus Omnitrophota bacterium]